MDTHGKAGKKLLSNVLVVKELTGMETSHQKGRWLSMSDLVLIPERGWRLITNEPPVSCVYCGSKINPTEFYFCPTNKFNFCEKCKTKFPKVCLATKDGHEHFHIVEVKNETGRVAAENP